jgi:hypothetical protein
LDYSEGTGFKSAGQRSYVTSRPIGKYRTVAGEDTGSSFARGCDHNAIYRVAMKPARQE